MAEKKLYTVSKNIHFENIPKYGYNQPTIKKRDFCRSWKWKFMLAAKWSALIKIDFEGEGERKAVQGNGSWQMVDSLLFSLLVNVLLSNGDWPFLQNQNFFHREPFSNQSLLQFFKTKCSPGVIKGKEFMYWNFKSHKKVKQNASQLQV